MYCCVTIKDEGHVILASEFTRDRKGGLDDLRQKFEKRYPKPRYKVEITTSDEGILN